MSRELTALDSVLEIERQVHEQETNLKAQLQKAERRKKLRSIMLTTPLVCFILLTFAFPILDMLYRSVDNREISLSLPQTIQALESWDYQGQPHQEVIEAFSVEVLALYQSKELPKIANRMNIEESGMRSLLMKTGRKLSRLTSLPISVTQLAKLDKRWANPKYWAAFKNLSGALTFSHYLAVLDLQVNEFGDIEPPQPEKRQIYVDLFFKTFWMSISITLICLVMAYPPVAYLLANLPDKRANLLLIIVLLPFWTSLLVRTTSWIVLLQNQGGVINDLLIWSGFTSERIQMIHNTFGTVVSMVHILLPFMILPLYSVMKGISPTYFRAARSLGATPFIAFIKVYMPLTLPGIGAGGLAYFHSFYWLLHYARFGWWKKRTDDIQYDCLSYADITELGGWLAHWVDCFCSLYWFCFIYSTVWLA